MTKSLMTPKTPDSSSRASLGFLAAVTEIFGPMLASRGFTCTTQSLYSVEFQSSKMVLVLTHGRISYEIELLFAQLASPLDQYNLSNLLDAAIGPNHQRQAYFQASQPARVVDCVRAIAAHLSRYGQEVLAGDPTAFQRVAELARKQNAAYTNQIVQGPTREAAEAAWRQ